MVKPPKTMQPESVDLKKAARTAGKGAFQDEDSFRNYMARKIDLQRKQFGLVIPPPPPQPQQLPQPEARQQQHEEEKKEESNLDNSSNNHHHNRSMKRSPLEGGSSGGRSSNSSVRFHPDVVVKRRRMSSSSPIAASDSAASDGDVESTRNDDHINNDTNNSDHSSSSSRSSNKKKRSRKNKKQSRGGSSGSISAIVKRLKRRHGRVMRLREIEEEEEGQEGDEDDDEADTMTTTSGQNDSNLRGEGSVVEANSASIVGTSNTMSAESRPAAAAIQDKTNDTTENLTTAIVRADDDDDDDDDTSAAAVEQHPRQNEELATSPISMNASTTSARKKSLQEEKQILKRSRPDLFFLGVVVIVNGYTNPDTETLQRMLHRRGGDLERYETSRVTHVIAENMSTAKADSYKRKKKNPLPVCKPSWIVDSVKAQKLLPHEPYLIDEVRNTGIQSVANFFRQNNRDDTVVTSSNNNDASGNNAKSLKNSAATIASTGKSNNIEALPKLTAEGTGGKFYYNKAVETNDTGGDNSISQVEGDKAVVDKLVVEGSSSKNNGGTNNNSQGVAVEHESEKVEVSDSSKPPQFRGYDSSPSKRTDNKYINGRLRTTGTDPNFLDTYFASSRLSFIGSYKQRARPSPTKRGKDPAVATGIKGVGEKRRRFVFHVDMDCFFAQVVLRNFPEYRNKPVAISHAGGSDDASSTSECATCNYAARKFGIKKGMFLGRARQLCPSLVVLNYDFEGYEEVSDQVADIIFGVAAEYDGSVEQVSCDEAYLELHIGDDDNYRAERIVNDLATTIRQEIFERTQCTASIGIASNKLLAKLGTDRVKPDGSFIVQDYRDVLQPLKLRDLHGVGYCLDKKLAEEGLTSVLDVWDLGESGEAELIRILGPGTGKKLFSYCYGKDDRPIAEAKRKTIGAECSYGVRFDVGEYGPDHMIAGLAKEVEKRMAHVAVKGSKCTLKIKQRVKGAPPPGKFLGHGHCHNLSRSCDIGEATRDWKVISRSCSTLFAELRVHKDDVRGMGIIVSKLSLNNRRATTGAESKQSLRNWFKDASTMNNEAPEAPKESSKQPNKAINTSDDEKLTKSSNKDSQGCHVAASSSGANSEEFDIALPPLSQLDMREVEALPSPLREQALSMIEKQKSRAAPQPEIESNTTRFRQTNVKRMLRLFSVKAGTETVPKTSGEDVSASQLERLPLETQLQVANGDNLGLGWSTQAKTQKNKKRTRVQGRTATARRVRNRPNALEAAAVIDPAASRTEAKPTDDMPSLSFPNPRDFFCDNVSPLHDFLDENPEASHEAKEQVKEFLLLCVGENRLPDAVILLRSIKNRKDKWRADPFDWLLEEVNQAMVCKYGTALDKCWV